jgi:hypothetical protein
MTKEEVIQIMLDSFNEDARMMGLYSGMSEEETEDKIRESQMSLAFLLSNAYDKLEELKIFN